MGKKTACVLALSFLLSGCVETRPSSSQCSGCADNGVYSLTIEEKSKSYIVDYPHATYKAGERVEFTTGVIADADLELYLDDICYGLPSSWSSKDAKWHFSFDMPAGDTVLSLRIYSPETFSFVSQYGWAASLNASDLGMMSLQNNNFDIGPGGMDEFYHDDSSASKESFLQFTKSAILAADKYRTRICGGYNRIFSVSVNGISHKLIFNSSILDYKYVVSGSFAFPSVYDYSSFIDYGAPTIMGKDGKAVRTIDGDYKISSVHFKPFVYQAAPTLTGFSFNYGAGVEFVDAKHFKYANGYYEIVTESDFGAFVNG